MVIGKYIRQLLEERKRVILPGFGNLEIKETSEVPSSGGRLDPPGPAVKFDASFSKDDGQLASTMTTGEGVDTEKATQWVLELVDAIRFALDKGEPCTIPETGTFTRDENGKIHFRADPEWILEPEQYGLEPMDLLELEDNVPVEEVKERSGEDTGPSEGVTEEEVTTGRTYPDLKFSDEAEEEPEDATARTEGTPEEPEDAPSEPEKAKVTPLFRDSIPQEKKRQPARRWKIIWIIAAVLVLALLVVIFLPADLKERMKKVDQTEIPVTDPRSTPGDETAEPLIEDEQSVSVEEAVEDPVEEQAGETVLAGGTKYYIIAGSFNHLSYASDLQDELKRKGYPAEVMFTDNRMYRVSVLSFASKEEAERELTGIKRVQGLESCWLLAN